MFFGFCELQFDHTRDAEAPYSSMKQVRIFLLRVSDYFPVGECYLKELLSSLVPAKPPPAVIPGNSITTGGIRLYLRVDSTRRPIGTFGSTRAVRASTSTLRIFDNLPMLTVLLR